MVRIIVRTSLIFSMALLLGGCPGGEESSGPVETCTSAGVQCKMEGGQLGVCTSDLKSDPPSYFCMSQH